MRATLCDRSKTPIPNKPATLEVRLTDGDGVVLFSTNEPIDLCDECADTMLGILRTRVVLKDSNLAAFSGTGPSIDKATAAPKAPAPEAKATK